MSITGYTKAKIDQLLAAFVPTPTGGTDGQALVKSGTSVVWGTVAGGSVTAANITDATTVGRSVLTAASAAAGRTAIGAGTSSFSGAYTDLTGKPTIPAAYTDAQAVAAVATIPQTQQTGTAYTLALTDVGTVVETTNSATTTVTVPLNSATAFPVGSTITVRQYGAGQVTIAGTSGVVLRSRGSALKLAGQYAEASITKRAADEWIVSGDLTT